MAESPVRTLIVSEASVQCLPEKREEVLKCRFCVHSVRFHTKKTIISSPARAYCNRSRNTGEIDVKEVTEVICDDMIQEGYRSILNVIS